MGKQTLGKKLLHSKFFGLLLFTIVLVIIITLIKSSFLSRGNIRQLFITMTIPGIMLVSVAPLLISGGIDLAAASEAILGSMVFAQLLSFFPALPWGVALILALLVGGVFALINVFLVNNLHFMSFIATIGMSSVYSGFATMWTRTNNVQINRTSFLALGKAAILWDWVPWLFVISVALVLVYGYILSSTPFGRSVYMVGGNPYAARLAGLKPKKIQAYLFINSSVMAVLAGIAWSAYKKMASPTALGISLPNFAALTAAILGGVSFFGGAGGMAGAFAGLLLVNVFTSGLNMLGLPSYISIALQGLILIAALIIDNFSTSRQRKALLKAAIAGDTVKKAGA